MRIAVDFDSTLADTMPLVCELVSYKMGEHVTEDDCVTWSYLVDRFGEKAFWGCFDLMDRTHLRRALRPTSPFACPTVKWLVQQGHTVELLTAANPVAAHDIIGWLFGHGLDIPVRAIGRTSVRVKWMLGRNAPDGRGGPYDVYIDDAPALAEEACKETDPDGLPVLVLVDQPWNRAVEYERSPRVFRLRDWRNAVDLVEQFVMFESGEK